MIDERDRRIASSMYQIALGMVVGRGTEQERTLALEALFHPSPTSIRALIEMGRGQPWLPSVIDAMAEIGIAAAATVLGDDDE